MKTFYEQLSLSRFASDEEIRAVIAQKRQELEPHDQADGFRRALLSRLEAAERILLNPERRARYDQDIDHQKAGSPGQAPKISASPIFSSASSTTPITPGQNVQRDRQQRLDDRPTEKSSCEICGASMAQDAISCSVCGAERTVVKARRRKNPPAPAYHPPFLRYRKKGLADSRSSFIYSAGAACEEPWSSRINPIRLRKSSFFGDF